MELTYPDHEIRPQRLDAEPSAQLGADCRHLDRLIDEGHSHAERRRLQQESLAGLPDRRPVRRIARFAHQHRNPAGAANLPGVLGVLRAGGEEPVEEQTTQVGR